MDNDFSVVLTSEYEALLDEHEYTVELEAMIIDMIGGGVPDFDSHQRLREVINESY
jgi:hypothetical protein